MAALTGSRSMICHMWLDRQRLIPRKAFTLNHEPWGNPFAGVICEARVYVFFFEKCSSLSGERIQERLSQPILPRGGDFTGFTLSECPAMPEGGRGRMNVRAYKYQSIPTKWTNHYCLIIPREKGRFDLKKECSYGIHVSHSSITKSWITCCFNTANN